MTDISWKEDFSERFSIIRRLENMRTNIVTLSQRMRDADDTAIAIRLEDSLASIDDCIRFHKEAIGNAIYQRNIHTITGD